MISNHEKVDNQGDNDQHSNVIPAFTTLSFPTSGQCRNTGQKDDPE
jgi:hypothetical protein